MISTITGQVDVRVVPLRLHLLRYMIYDCSPDVKVGASPTIDCSRLRQLLRCQQGIRPTPPVSSPDHFKFCKAHLEELDGMVC